MPLSIDPENTWAILIGVGEFENREKNLPAIPAVDRNLADLHNLFKNKDKRIIGIHEDKIKPIPNLTRDNMVERLNEILPSGFKANTLIIYYVGHGILDKKERLLYLATYNSQYDKCNTALDFRELYKITYQKANNVLYILDCCNSGNVLQDGKLEKLFPNDKKIAMLTSTKPDNNAKSSGENGLYTAFTGNLIELLKEGYGNEETLTTLKVFEGLTEKFKKQGIEDEYLPWHHDFSTKPFHFAYNRAYSQPESLSTMSSNSVTAFDSSLTPLHLVIALMPPSLPSKKPKKCRIRAWLFTQGQGRDVYEEKTTSFSLEDLKMGLEKASGDLSKEIRQIFGNIRNDLIKHNNELTLEFFLPIDLLLDYSIEGIHVSGSKFPIGFDYKVLIRPWERIAHRFDYAPAPKRKKSKNDDTDIASFFRLCGHWNNGDKLQKEFESCVELLKDANQGLPNLKKSGKSVFSVNFKPNKEFFDDMVHRGIPIILWIRDDVAKKCHAGLHNNWLSHRLLEIPELLHEERDPGSKEHIGHISLLWDDPSRVVPPLENFELREPKKD